MKEWPSLHEVWSNSVGKGQSINIGEVIYIKMDFILSLTSNVEQGVLGNDIYFIFWNVK